LQQFALVRSGPNTTAKIPDNITEDEAATIPTALNTASVALYDADGFGFPSPFEKGGETFGNGKSILVLGGSSVIGLVGIPSLVTFVRLISSTSIRSSFGILSNHYYSTKET
jgi:NADPH:quinone reductase-like Zn-dependent oxidoreductase